MNITKQPVRLSRIVLVALVSLTIIVFGAFWLIGFDMPFFDNPQFNAPLLTDLVIVFIYIMLLLAIAAVAVSMSGLARRSRKQQK